MVADALSRAPISTKLQGLNVSRSQLLDHRTIQQEIWLDPRFQKIIQDKGISPILHPKLQVHNSTLLYKGWLVLISSSQLLPLILQTYHVSTLGGHIGFKRTYKWISQDLYWPKIKQTIKAYVDQCHMCQANKISLFAPVGLLQPLPIPEKIWDEISMDFIEGLPKS